MKQLRVVVLFITVTTPVPTLSDENLPKSAVASCSASTEAIDIAPPKKSDKNQKVRIKADEIDFPGRKIVHLRGTAELKRGGNRVYADELIYNNNKAQVQAVAKGSVKFQTAEGDIIYTSILRYYLTVGKIVSGKASFVIASREDNPSDSTDKAIDSYGTASRVTLLGRSVMILDNASIVSCLDGKEHTVFTATELRVNLNEGIRTAKHVKIRIAPQDQHDRIQEMAK